MNEYNKYNLLPSLEGNITCKNGFMFTCHATPYHMCLPKRWNTTYTKVEVRFYPYTFFQKLKYFFFRIEPFRGYNILRKYNQTKKRVFLQTIYGFVPVKDIRDIILLNDGIEWGESIPDGIFNNSYNY